MIVELKHFGDLRDYIIQKSNVEEIVSFCNLNNIDEFIDIQENYCKNHDAIILEFKDKNEIEGYIIGIVVQDRELNDKIDIIVNLEYDNINVLKQLVKKFKAIIKSQSCNYLKIQVPEYQKDILEILAENGYNSYRVELEKKLD